MMDISKEAARRVLEGDASLGAAFVWADTAQGHKFWERQADEGLTAEGRAILERIAYGDKPKFAVGDRVRVVNNKDNGGRNIAEYRVGEVHTITGTCRGTKGDAWLLNNHYQYLHSDQIEPVSAAPQPQLTIREGRYYKTRDGRKVGPMERTGTRYDPIEYPFTVSHEFDTGGYGKAWRANGTFSVNRDRTNPADLIAEWVDEPVFKIGDRVKFVDDYATSSRGKEAIVIDAPPSTWGFKVRQIESGNASTEHAYSLRLVASATTAQCIVALIENGQPKPAARPFVHADREAATKEARRLAGKHKGQKFGVYELVSSERQDKVYEHERQRLAASGRKIDAIKRVRDATGFTLKGAKDAVEHWLAVEAA